MKIILFISLFISLIGSAFANCEKAGLNYEEFLNETTKKMISAANSTKNYNEKINELKVAIDACVDVEKISKRVLGRAKWQGLSTQEQGNFIEEYKKYFV